MIQPQPYLDADRRRPRVSHEELRRDLIDSDEERYRLRCELEVRSTEARRAYVRTWRRWAPRKRRVTIGVSAAIAGALAAIAGTLAGVTFWKVYAPWAHADGPSPLRVETTIVTAHVVPPQVSTVSVPPRMGPAVAAARRRPSSEPHPRRPLHKTSRSAMLRVMPHLGSTPRHRTAPRPLSPGEFGRKAL